MDEPTIRAPWRHAGRAAIEYQALLLPLDQGLSSAVRPGVRLWLPAEVDTALSLLASASPVEAAPSTALRERLLGLVPEGDFRATDSVRLAAADCAGDEWVFAFDAVREIDPDGDPAPARLCVLLRLDVGGSRPLGLRFEFRTIAATATPAPAPPATARGAATLALRLV